MTFLADVPLVAVIGVMFLATVGVGWWAWCHGVDDDS